MVYSESDICRRRVNGRLSTEAVLIQAAISSTLGGGSTLKNALEAVKNGE